MRPSPKVFHSPLTHPLSGPLGYSYPSSALPGQLTVPPSPVRAKRRAPRGKPSRLTRILALLGVLYFLYSFVHLGLSLYRVEKEIAFYQQQKAALLQEQARLKEEIAKLNTDTYIERLAREELGYIKPGEKIVLPAKPAQDIPPYVPPPPGHEFRD